MAEQVAKLFPNGRSQAVRLPAAFRFESDEVYIRRDEETGEIILSPVPNTWDGFFAARDNAHEEVTDFLADRVDPAPQSRSPLEEKRSRKRVSRRA